MSPRTTVRPAAAAALLLLVALGLVTLGLAGCGAKPAPIPPSESELGDRPGLLSGPTGEFTIYRQ